MFLLRLGLIEDIDNSKSKDPIFMACHLFLVINLKKIRNKKKFPSFNRMCSTKHFMINLIVNNCVTIKSTQRRYRIKRRKIHIFPD